MSSSPETVYTLTATADELGVELRVLDSGGMAIASTDEQRITLKLPRGIYTVRAERNGLYEDTSVRLTESRHVAPTLPQRYSAIPLPDAATTHEYYSYSAWDVSTQYTAPDIPFDGTANASIMLFLRAPAEDRVTSQQKTEHLVLRSLEGDVLHSLNGPDVITDEGHGFAGFSARMSSSDVLLEDFGEVRRQTRLPLLGNFQTQVYFMYLGRPLYEDIRVLTIDYSDISTRQNRGPYDRNEFTEITEQVDAGMAALQNNVEDIGAHLVNNFLVSKFHNPILGLLGAYLMLLRRHRRSSESFDAELPAMVIDNLAELIPGSSDVVALRHLAAEWLGPPALEPVSIPPLFRVGADVVIKAAAREPSWIPENSLFDLVSDRILGDSAWTTWSAIDLPVEQYIDQGAVSDNDDMGWVEIALADKIASLDEALPIEDLAERVGVTQRAINKAFKNLSKHATERPDVLQKEGYDTALIDRIQSGTLPGAWLSSGLLSKIDSTEPSMMTYQRVYPVIKSALSEYTSIDRPVKAADSVADILDDKALNSVRRTILKELLRQYPGVGLTALSPDEGKSRLNTVRDMADMLIKKHQL